MHSILRNSSLPVLPSAFPYNPHCTLRSGNATPKELSRVLDNTFPTACFTIDTISVYDYDSESIYCNLIYRKGLRAEQGAAVNP